MLGCLILTVALINEAVALHGSTRSVALHGGKFRMATRVVSKAEVMSTMTVKSAYEVFLRMNQTHMDRDLVAQIKSEIGASLHKGEMGSGRRRSPPVDSKSEPTGYAAVDKARDMLNDMMDTAVMKRELEGVRLNEFEN